MPPLFPGLSPADFDAYQPSRATSNAFVRPRLEVKQKLLAAGRELAEAARARGVSLDVHASDERPSIWNRKSVTEQWVFLWRDAAERAELERAGGHERPLGAALMDPTPYYLHAFLALYLDHARFEVALRVHRDAWADVKNLRRRLESEGGRAAIGEALRALPDGFTIGTTAGTHGAAREVDPAHVVSLLDEAEAAGGWFYVARAVERDEAVARGADLRALIDDAFDALLPLYRLVAWRRDDDLASISEELERERAERAHKVEEVAAREAEWLARHTAEIEKQREQAAIAARERLAAKEPARPAAVHAATASLAHAHAASQPRPAPRAEPPRRDRPRDAAPSARADAPSRAPAPQPAPSAPRPAPKREVPSSATEWVESAGPVGVGSRVRVARGAFAGREGAVTEVDGKGQARVAIGPLSVRVDVATLVALAPKG